MLVCFSMFSEFRNTDLKYKESYTLFPRLLDILAKRLPYYVPSPTLQQIPERSSVALTVFEPHSRFVGQLTLNRFRTALTPVWGTNYYLQGVDSINTS